MLVRRALVRRWNYSSVVPRACGASSASSFHNGVNASQFIKNENKLFDKFMKPLRKNVEDIQESLLKDYIEVSSTLESTQSQDEMHDVSGPYEYYSKRGEKENYCNIYRHLIGSSDHENVVNLDKLGDFYHQGLTLVDFKLAPCHTLAAVIIELHESGRHAVLIKDIGRNVACEISLSHEINPVSIEVLTTVTVANEERGSSGVCIFITSTLDSVRPSEVYKLEFSPSQLFGNLGWSNTQRVRNVSASEENTQLVVDEPRPAFFLSLSRSKDDRWLILHHHSKTSSQITLIDAVCPGNDPFVLKKAIPGEQCFVDCVGGYFYSAVRRSIDAELEIQRTVSREIGFLSTDHFNDPSVSWTHIWPSEQDVHRGLFIEDYDIFEKQLVSYGRSQSTAELFVQIVNLEDGSVVKEYTCESLVPILGSLITTLHPLANGNYRSSTVRFEASSPILPGTSFEVELATGEIVRHSVVQSSLLTKRPTTQIKTSFLDKFRNLLNKQLDDNCGDVSDNALLGLGRGFTCERRYVESSTDKYSVPIILCGPTASEGYDISTNNDVNTNTAALSQAYASSRALVAVVDNSIPRPTILFGYASYGVSIPTNYRSELAVMLSRGWLIGFVYARGGGEKGKQHHRAGSGLNKWNTFYDFKDAARFLIDNGYTSPSLLCASGSSAGGLIPGVMLNEYHQMFAACSMRNPFLGIYETVQDPSSPLVIHEYDEWGHTSLSDDTIHQQRQQSEQTHKQEDEGCVDSNAVVEETLAYIKSFSPTDNISSISLHSSYDDHHAAGDERNVPGRFPAVYLTLGLEDDRVDPVQAMVWTTRLRNRLATLSGQQTNGEEVNNANDICSSYSTCDHDRGDGSRNIHCGGGSGGGDVSIIVRLQEGVGHEGPSSVETQIEEEALEIAFLESIVQQASHQR